LILRLYKVISMRSKYLRAVYAPLMPNPTRRHVSIMDTSAKSTTSSFCSALSWKNRPHIQCLSVTTFTSSNRTAAPASCSSFRRWTSSLHLWRRSDECEVYLNSLIQQLGIMRPINRSSSLVQCWVFNECISLRSMID